MTRVHRIFSDQVLKIGQGLTLWDETAHYLARVLRLTVGQTVGVFNGDGSDYLAEITDLQRGQIHLVVLSGSPASTESRLKITLVQAISRGERMDITLQKATELGVSAFQPVFTVRTEVRLREEKLSKRMKHWHKVIISACEQSGRARIPGLNLPVNLMDWAQGKTQAKRILLSPGAEESLLSVTTGSTVELLVGPEGGLDEREQQTLVQLGVVAASLGPRILRTETAGPAAIAIMQAIAGDMD